MCQSLFPLCTLLLWYLIFLLILSTDLEYFLIVNTKCALYISACSGILYLVGKILYDISLKRNRNISAKPVRREVSQHKGTQWKINLFNEKLFRAICVSGDLNTDILFYNFFVGEENLNFFYETMHNIFIASVNFYSTREYESCGPWISFLRTILTLAVRIMNPR